MREVFADLHDTKIMKAWSGSMAFAFDFLPEISVQDGLHCAIACNGGAGIVMMSWLGRKAARDMRGTANRDSAFAGLPFKPNPSILKPRGSSRSWDPVSLPRLA